MVIFSSFDIIMHWCDHISYSSRLQNKQIFVYKKNKKIDARFSDHFIYISGDMIIIIVKNVTNNYGVQSYLNLMYSYGLLPKILRPTRVLHNTTDLIDHIWFNRDDRISSSSIWFSDKSDHFPTFISLKSSGTVRNVADFSQQKFRYPATISESSLFLSVEYLMNWRQHFMNWRHQMLMLCVGCFAPFVWWKFLL